MTGDPFTFLFEIFSGFLGLVFLILWLVMFARVGQVRDEARRQTSLLEQIAKNTRKAEDAPKSTSSLNYIRDEPKVPAGVILTVLSVLAAILIAVALARK